MHLKLNLGQSDTGKVSKLGQKTSWEMLAC